MNHRKLMAATLAIILSFSAVAATAQPRDHRDDRGDRHGQRDGRDDRGDRRDHGDHRGGPDRHPGKHYGHGPKAKHMGDRGRGVGPDHRFYRGDRLPPGFRTRHYYVEDWRGHRLSAPPRGYRWVQVDADYVMIAVATGLIAQIVLSR